MICKQRRNTSNGEMCMLNEECVQLGLSLSNQQFRDLPEPGEDLVSLYLLGEFRHSMTA